MASFWKLSITRLTCTVPIVSCQPCFAACQTDYFYCGLTLGINLTFSVPYLCLLKVRLKRQISHSIIKQRDHDL